MIRILTSLVALFTVTTIQTQAALNQFSKLLTNIVGEQAKTTTTNLAKHTLINNSFAQLSKKNAERDHQNNNFLIFTLSLLWKSNFYIENNLRYYSVVNIFDTSFNKQIFHIRSPNFISII